MVTVCRMEAHLEAAEPLEPVPEVRGSLDEVAIAGPSRLRNKPAASAEGTSLMWTQPGRTAPTMS